MSAREDKRYQLANDRGLELPAARALLRGAKVLAFDEPTSALDAIREKEIIDAIKK